MDHSSASPSPADEGAQPSPQPPSAARRQPRRTPSAGRAPDRASARVPPPKPEREPGWQALAALRGAESDALLAIMMRPSFKPIHPQDTVVVAPCPHCGDGGLRTVGSVKTRAARAPVRACDTCGTVEIGELGRATILKLPDTRHHA